MSQIIIVFIFMFVIFSILKNLNGKGSSSYFNGSTRINDTSDNYLLHNNSTDLNGDGISDNMKHSAHIANENTINSSQDSNFDHDSGSCESCSDSGSCDCGSSND